MICLQWTIPVVVTHNFAQNAFLIYTGFSASNGGHFPVYSTTFLPWHWFSLMGTAKFRGFGGKLGSCSHIIIDPIHPEMRSMTWNFYDASARYAALRRFNIIR